MVGLSEVAPHAARIAIHVDATNINWLGKVLLKVLLLSHLSALILRVRSNWLPKLCLIVVNEATLNH